MILLDADVRDSLLGINVWVDASGYPSASINGSRVRLHSHILGEGSGGEVDHINRNELDCRRVNLRFASKAQNARNCGVRSHNSSGFKGVYFCKQTKKWRAEIRVSGKGIKLGRFDNKLDAAIAYDKASEKYHGEFGVTNFALGLLAQHWSTMTTKDGKTLGVVAYLAGWVA